MFVVYGKVNEPDDVDFVDAVVMNTVNFVPNHIPGSLSRLCKAVITLPDRFNSINPT